MDESKRGFVALSSELKKKSPLIEGDNKNIKSQLLRYFSMDKQLSVSEFKENYFAYGNLQEPNQNLLFIDVALKIFNLLITYNKNIFVLFYENGLMTSFDHLSKDLTSLLSFLVSKNIECESLLHSRKASCIVSDLNEYGSVLKKVTSIMT